MQAVSVMTTSNRYQSGLVEVALKNVLKDKSNWRTLLKQDAEKVNLQAEAERFVQLGREFFEPILAQYPQQISLLSSYDVQEINYPILKYPEKICSLSLDKTSVVEGVLQGIKGQYWILDTGVINIRKFSGYNVIFKVGAS